MSGKGDQVLQLVVGGWFLVMSTKAFSSGISNNRAQKKEIAERVKLAKANPTKTSGH